MTGKLPLTGHLVLDLSIAQSGPVLAWQLGSLGATVVKIERVVPSGQPPRTSIDLGNSPADGIPGERPWHRDALFNFIHANKKSVTLNLNDARGRELFLRLADQSSVIIENFSARVMKAFGLDYPVLAGRNPRLVYVSIKAHGLTGPKQAYSGFHSTANAEAGLGSLLNYGDGIAQSIGWPAADIISSAWAGACVMAALLEARETGEGRLIDLSMTEAVSAVLDDFVVQAQVEDEPWSYGSQAEPVHVVRCRDGEWLAVCLSDTAYASSASMPANGSIEADLDRRASEFDRADLGDALAAAGVASSPVLKAPDILREPPVGAYFWTEVEHPEVGRRQQVMPPFRFEPPLELAVTPAPLHGQHTAEILGELLGISPSVFAELRRNGVVWHHGLVRTDRRRTA
jgi:crotonobetainyl-CoA:carnitine CoA-transferase CaiB-like acyl-CoA transferase